MDEVRDDNGAFEMIIKTIAVFATIAFQTFSLALAADLPTGDCKIEVPSPGVLRFCKHLAVGEAPLEKNPNLLDVVGDLPLWGTINSVAMGVYRNGKRVRDIDMSTMGISPDPKTGKLGLKFQLVDNNVDSVQKNDYVFDATFHFEPKNQ